MRFKLIFAISIVSAVIFMYVLLRPTLSPGGSQLSLRQRQRIDIFSLLYLQLKQKYMNEGVIDLPDDIRTIARNTVVHSSIDWTTLHHYSFPVQIVSASGESGRVPLLWDSGEISSEKKPTVLFADGSVEVIAMPEIRRDSTTNNPATAIDELESGLKQLLEIDGDGAFATIRETESSRILQFAGSATEGLMLVLPAQGLSPVEQTRAHEFFSSVSSAQSQADGFYVSFGKDAKSAAALARKVYVQVYGVNSSRFEVDIDDGQ